MNLAEAKQRVSIFDLWVRFGFHGDPSKPCRCPFHEDRSPSFSVRADGALWNCFAGCGGGDAVDFFQMASGLPHGEACRQFIAIAPDSRAVVLPVGRRPRFGNSDADKAWLRNRWPAFKTAREDEDDTPLRLLLRLADLRKVSRAGALLMAERGLLWFGLWKDLPAWIVSDGSRCNAQARRIDGKLWPQIAKKAQTLPGSRAARPIGAKESEPFPVVLLVEGGPDLLAGHHFIVAHRRQADTAAVAILGASNRIPDDALPAFCGKRVRIFAHTDPAGLKGAEIWRAQLRSAGADVDVADFSPLRMADGRPIGDLNDLVHVRPQDAGQLEDLIP